MKLWALHRGNIDQGVHLHILSGSSIEYRSAPNAGNMEWSCRQHMRFEHSNPCIGKPQQQLNHLNHFDCHGAESNWQLTCTRNSGLVGFAMEPSTKVKWPAMEPALPFAKCVQL